MEEEQQIPDGMVTIKQLVEEIGGYYGAFLAGYKRGQIPGWRNRVYGQKSTVYMRPADVLAAIDREGLKIKGLKRDRSALEQTVDVVLQGCWRAARAAAILEVETALADALPGSELASALEEIHAEMERTL